MSVSRRMFLRGSGGFILAIPFLESLVPRSARAAPGAPRRFVLVRTDHGGMNDARWCPPQSMLTQQTDLLPNHVIKWGPLTPTVADGRASLSPMLSASQSALTDRLVGKMNFLRGIDITFGNGHNQASSLGVYSASAAEKLLPGMPGVTIDQVMASSPSFYPSLSGIKAKYLVPYATSFCFRTPGDLASGIVSNPTQATGDLYVLAGQLFTNLPTTPGVEAFDRKSFVDAVLQDYKRLRQGSRRLSTEDGRRLDDHMARLDEIHSRITTVASQACVRPEIARYTNDGTPEGKKLKNDIIVAAFSCDVTRIVVSNVSGAAYDKLHEADWHGIAHEAGGIEAMPNQPIPQERQELAQQWLTDANQKVFEQDILDLAQKLDHVDEGGASLLDNSLVVWSQESGFPSHATYDMKEVTFGSLGGTWKTGSYVDYRNQTPPCVIGSSYLGIPRTRLMANWLLAAGVPRVEWPVVPRDIPIFINDQTSIVTPEADEPIYTILGGYGRMKVDPTWFSNSQQCEQYKARHASHGADLLPVVT